MSLRRKEPSAVAALWARYARERGERTPQLRNALAQAYLRVVNHEAFLLVQRLPSNVEIGDLVSAGTFGLMAAIEDFDPARGVKFATYCRPRVRGAMLDWLRELDPVPRTSRVRNTVWERQAERFRQSHGREPDEAELAESLGRELDLTPELLDCWRESRRVANDCDGACSLQRVFATRDDKDMVFQHVAADATAADPAAEVERRDAFERLLRPLAKTQRVICRMMFLHGLNQDETARAIGLSPSRVSQLLSVTLQILRATITREPAGIGAAESRR